MLQMTSSRTGSIMAEKNQNGQFIAILFFTFCVNNLTFPNLLPMLLISPVFRTSSIMAKKIKMTDLLLLDYVNNLPLLVQ